MRHAGQFEARESVEERRRKAHIIIESVLPDNERLRGFVLNLIAQDDEDLSAQDDADPAYKLDLLRKALVDRIVALAHNEVQILVVEDIHWIDPSSEGIWNSLVERASENRILLLATCHADKFQAPTSPQVSQLRLDKLDAQQSVALASQIIDTGQFSNSLIADIVKRSDGVPLFVEELARNVSESGLSQSHDSPAGNSGNGKAEAAKYIPDTLQGTLLARLDRLGQSKRLAQFASVVGREFDADVLAIFAAEIKLDLVNDLKALVESGLIRVIKSKTPTTYEFKHGLIRQTAYDSLLRRDAVRLHSELAKIYEEHFPRVRTAQPEVLAQHLTISGRWLDASRVWLEAGVAAKDMGSTEEALRRFESCLHCLQSVESSDAADPVRMQCEMARGAAINSQFGPVEQSAHEAFFEAAALAEKLQDSSAVAESLISLSFVKYNSGDFSGAESVAGRLIECLAGMKIMASSASRSK